MAPIKTEWNRLVRFVAEETSQVHIGQPLDSGLDVGLASYENKPFAVHEIIGTSALDPTAQLTKNVLTVKTLLSPLSREEVGVVRCLGLNYADHAAEAKLEKPSVPVLFYKPPTTLIGPSTPLILPLAAQPVSENLPDYEVELVIIIGKPARNVKEKFALDYVLGWSAANDISFRKHQMEVSQWGFSKSFDNTNPFGPCIVSASSGLIPDPQNVKLKTTLNGRVVQDGNTSDQIFTVAKTIAFLSRSTTLLPGSIILTGTPKGVGFVKNPPVFLKDGDKLSVFVGGGIGTLACDVREEWCKKFMAKM